MESTPRRRWFQFNLRTLFVVVTVATIIFAAFVGIYRFRNL